MVDERDQRTYKTVLLEEQIWMAENLDYNAGVSCWYYNNDSSYAKLYGRMYQWEVASEACPEGWHLPGTKEWKTLRKFTRKYTRLNQEGDALKSTNGWNNNGSGTNLIGFNAHPGGFSDEYSFSDMGTKGIWWTSDKVADEYAERMKLSSDKSTMQFEDDNITNGFSVRCVKD